MFVLGDFRVFLSCLGIFASNDLRFWKFPMSNIWPEIACGISSETIILCAACVSESMSQFYFAFCFYQHPCVFRTPRACFLMILKAIYAPEVYRGPQGFLIFLEGKKL